MMLTPVRCARRTSYFLLIVVIVIFIIGVWGLRRCLDSRATNSSSKILFFLLNQRNLNKPPWVFFSPAATKIILCTIKDKFRLC